MELFHRHYGGGHPLIILHGLFGISDNWVTIGKRLAEAFSVYIVDQRNHGRSPHSSFFTYMAMVDDLDEFIETHGIENPVLLGHSMGGKVAMNYALDNPGRTGGLIAVDISPREYPGRMMHQGILEAMTGIDFNRISSRDEVEQHLRRSIDSDRVRQFILKNLERVDQHRLGWRINVDAINDNLFNVFEAVAGGRIYDGDTLFVRGGASGYVPDEDETLIRGMFPRAIIRTIPGATHWVHADKPDELCALLSEFLRKDCGFRD